MSRYFVNINIVSKLKKWYRSITSAYVILFRSRNWHRARSRNSASIIAQPNVATASWRAQMNLSSPCVAVAEFAGAILRDEMRAWDQEIWGETDGERGCSILSSSPEIIRRTVTKWNAPRVMTVSGGAQVDLTTELRESSINYFSRVDILRNYCAAKR